MASVSERHAGGRPRTRPETELFIRVKGMANRRGIQIDELARKAGVSPGAIYDLGDPRLSTLRKIASALGVKVGRLAD